jgi:HTH-type transcriptional regulator / antitoxin HigA
LIQELPLVRFKNGSELRRAQDMIHRLLQEDLDEGAQSYLDALVDLVQAYEDKHVAIPDAPESDVLRLLMTSNGLSQRDLAKKVGIAQSTISAVLTGSRTLTKNHVQKLARVFSVSPAVFMPRQ